MDGTELPSRRRSIYVGVFVVALATLILEILLTRITSVIAWYHLAFFVISLAMLGMTAGAVAVFLLPRFFADEDVPRRMSQATMAFEMSAEDREALEGGHALHAADDGRRGLVAGGFEGEDAHAIPPATLRRVRGWPRCPSVPLPG